MAGPNNPGIADDSSAYEDFPESGAKSDPRPSGAAEDSHEYEDLIPAVGEDALTLDASWIFKQHDQVFGPVSSKELLEKLYAGEVNAETPIAPENGDFMALRRYGAFRLHLPKVEAHRKETQEVRRTEKAAHRARIRNWVIFGAAILAAGGGVGAFVIQGIRTARLEEAEQKKLEEEKRIRDQMIESLMASLTIEPPLIEIADDEPDDPKSGPAGSKRRRAKRPKPGTVLPPTVELTRGEIMEGVVTVFGGLKRCIVEQIQRDPESVADRITLTFSVNNDGVVQNFDLEDRALRRAPIKDCMGGKLAQLRFRKFIGEVQNVEYPITIGGRR